MAEKKSTKKAVAKKAAPKKSTTKKTAVKKAAVKKTASKKTSPSKPVVKKSTTKKAAVRKPIAKASSAKTSPVKKATTKQAAVKKSTAKKAVSTRSSVKKAASKRTAPKRVTTSAVLDRPLRTQSIPEVPIRREFTSTPIASPVATKVEVHKSEGLASIPAVSASKSKSKQSKRDRALLAIAAIVIVIAGVVAFAVPSSNQNSVADGADQPAAEATASPSAESTIAAEPSPTESSEMSAQDGQMSETFGLRFSYNSIGITLNFASAQQLGSVKEFVVQTSENGGTFSTLATVQAVSSSIRIAKIDTVGKTSFRVEAVLENGSKVTSSPLTIRGLFSAE